MKCSDASRKQPGTTLLYEVHIMNPAIEWAYFMVTVKCVSEWLLFIFAIQFLQL